jgi:hypothetical protein
MATTQLVTDIDCRLIKRRRSKMREPRTLLECSIVGTITADPGKRNKPAIDMQKKYMM